LLAQELQGFAGLLCIRGEKLPDGFDAELLELRNEFFLPAAGEFADELARFEPPEEVLALFFLAFGQRLFRGLLGGFIFGSGRILGKDDMTDSQYQKSGEKSEHADFLLSL
jgi:hypothetical protein